MFKKWLQFLYWHERLILGALAAIVVLVGLSKWIAHRNRQDATQAQIAHDKVLTQSAATSMAEEKVIELQHTVDRQSQQLQSLRTEVLNAIAQRDKDAQTHEQAEATDPLQTVASRWATLIGSADSDVRVGPDGNVWVVPSAARQTTEALESGSAAKADYQDLSKLDSQKDKQIEGLNALVVSERDSARQEILLAQDQATSCKSDAKVAQDQASKKSRKSFWKGVATGAAAIGAIALRFL